MVIGIATDYPDIRQQLGLPSRESVLAGIARQPSATDFANTTAMPLSMWAPTAAPEDQPQEDPGALTRIGRTPGAAVERLSALSGTAIGSVAEAGTQALGATGIISPETQASVMARLEDTINKFRNLDIVKDPGLGLDYITQGSGGGGYVGRALLSGVGTLVTSSPDMVAAAVGGIPGGAAYASTYAADLARQHAVNRTGDANAAPTVEDYGYGFAIGLPSAALQMFGSNLVTGTLGKGMFKGLAEKVTAGADKVLSKYLGPATDGAMNRVRSAITTGGLEAITEFPQNQLDYLAATLGTDKFDVHEFWRQGIEGGVLAFLSGGIAGGVLPHATGAAKTVTAPPGGVTGLLGPDTTAPPSTPGAPPPAGPEPELPLPVGRQAEMFGPREITPPVRKIGAAPGPDPATHPLSEVGTVVDPSQMTLPTVAPPQGELAIGPQASGATGRTDLLPTTLRDPSAAPPAPPEPEVVGQSSLLSLDIVAAMESHNALPQGARPEQGEMFRAQQVAGPQIPLPLTATRGGPEPVHPLAETGTIVDAAQRSALNPAQGANAPVLDPSFLASQARRRLAALRNGNTAVQTPAVAALPAAVAGPETPQALPASAGPGAVPVTPAAPSPAPSAADFAGAPAMTIDRLMVPPVGPGPGAVIPETPATAAAQPAASPTVPTAAGPLAQRAQLRLRQPVTSFRTAQGSTYNVKGETTQRTKSLHQGHAPTDVGLKERSQRTVYVSPQDARKIGMHGTLSGAKTLFIHGDEVLPVAWNEAGGRWGIAPSDRGIKFTTTPEVGKAPVEVWSGKPDGSYGKWHAGNPIVSVGTLPGPAPAAPLRPHQAAPTTTPTPPRTERPVRAEPAALQAQPQGPQIAISPTVPKPEFVRTPSRSAALIGLRNVAVQSNHAGAALSLPNLREMVRKAVDRAPGVPMEQLERAAGLQPGSIEKQFEALERLARSRDVAGEVARSRAYDRPKRGRGPAESTRPTATPSEGGTVGGHRIYPKRSPKSALNRIAEDHLSPVSAMLQPLAKTILKLGTNPKIEVVDHLPANIGGRYFPDEHRIEIRSDLTPAEHDIVLMHELVHAAAVDAVRDNPTLRAELESIVEAVKNSFNLEHPMFENGDELLAYGMTDPAAQEYLSMFRYGPERRSAWQRFKEWVAKALGLKTQDHSVLDRVLELGHQAMHEQAHSQALARMDRGEAASYPGALQHEMRRLGGYTAPVANPRDNPLGTQVDRTTGKSGLMAKLGRPMPAAVRDALTPQQAELAWANYDHAVNSDGSLIVPPHNLSLVHSRPPARGSDRVLNAERGALTRGLLSTSPERRAEFSEGAYGRFRRMVDQPGDRTRGAIARVQSVNQLVQWYAKHFGEGVNPLVRWMESFDTRRRHEGVLRELAQDIQQKHNDLPELDQQKLGEIAIFSTMNGVDPSSGTAPVTIDSTDRPRIKADKAKQIRAWERAKPVYEALSPEAKQVFQESKDFFKERFLQTRVLLLQSVLQTRGVDPSQITPATTMGEVLSMFEASRKHPSRAPTKAERNILGLIRATFHTKPVYFPLRRTGRYYTSVEHKDVVEYASRDERFADTERQDSPTVVRTRVVKAPTAEDLSETVEYTYRDVAFHGTVQEGREYLAALKSDNPELHDSVITQPTLRRAEQGGYGVPVQTLIARLHDNLGTDTQAARDATDTVLSLMPELSTWKAKMQRRNIPGVKADEFRVAMAREMKSRSRQEAILKYSRELAGHMNDMRKLQREVNRSGDAERASKMNILLNQLDTLQTLERQLPPGPLKAAADRLTGVLGFTAFLVSPSFSVVNMSQVWANTLPTLGGRYGYGPTLKALHQASAAIHRKRLFGRAAVTSLLGAKALGRLVSSKVKPDEKIRRIEDTIKAHIAESSIPHKADVLRLMDDLITRGRAGETQAQDLLHTAREGGVLGKTINDALEIAREMAQAAETTNRVVTGISSYLLERQRGSDHETATRRAVDDIDLTQFQYDPEYRSEVFKKSWRFATQFKEYPLGTYNLLATHFANAFARGKTPEERSAGRKSLAGMALSYSLMAGVMGSFWNEPTRLFVNTLFYLWNTMTGEDINPEDEMRKWLRDVASEIGGSPWVGEAVVGGLPRLAGVDLSGRTGLTQLLFPAQVRGTTAADKALNAVSSFLFGPVIYNTGINSITMLSDPSVQNLMASLPFVPKTVQDIVKAYRLHDQGLTDASGDTLIAPQDIDTYTLMMQAMGFTPGEVARLREKRSAVFRLTQAESDRRDKLVQEFRNTPATERASILAQIHEFNSRKPIQPITQRTLVNSLTAKAQRRREIVRSGGIDLPARQIPKLNQAVGVMP